VRVGKETVVVCVGIDLHRRSSHVVAFDAEGLEVLSRRVSNEPEALRAIFAELGGEARVALEAAFAGSGSRICSRRRGSSCSSRIRGRRRRSLPHG
jgi:hypothetical protein